MADAKVIAIQTVATWVAQVLSKNKPKCYGHLVANSMVSKN
jgi:hypothetical protein